MYIATLCTLVESLPQRFEVLLLCFPSSFSIVLLVWDILTPSLVLAWFYVIVLSFGLNFSGFLPCSLLFRCLHSYCIHCVQVATVGIVSLKHITYSVPCLFTHSAQFIIRDVCGCIVYMYMYM